MTGKLVLLTGATGYVGGRLRPLLEKQGHPLRCLARVPKVLQARVAKATEVVQGDLEAGADLEPVFRGVSAAIYLVHSLANTEGFEEAEQRTAQRFANFCRQAGAEIRQTALFDAKGLGGLVYWHTLYAVHALIFSAMFQSIVRQIEEAS